MLKVGRTTVLQIEGPITTIFGLHLSSDVTDSVKHEFPFFPQIYSVCVPGRHQNIHDSDELGNLRLHKEMRTRKYDSIINKSALLAPYFD